MLWEKGVSPSALLLLLLSLVEHKHEEGECPGNLLSC